MSKNNAGDNAARRRWAWVTARDCLVAGLGSCGRVANSAALPSRTRAPTATLSCVSKSQFLHPGRAVAAGARCLNGGGSGLRGSDSAARRTSACWPCASGSRKGAAGADCRMQFLKTVFWVLIAVLVVLFAVRNWTPVTLNLWTDIQAETKLPMLVFVGFLIGWLPTWLIMRARLWTMKRRVEGVGGQHVGAVPSAPAG